MVNLNLMKLSVAVALGDVAKRREPLVFLSHDGTCGCALGGAVLAAGLAKEFQHERAQFAGKGGITALPCIAHAWPWLRQSHVDTISAMYTMRLPVEAIVAYVEGVELGAAENAEINRRTVADEVTA